MKKFLPLLLLCGCGATQEDLLDEHLELGRYSFGAVVVETTYPGSPVGTNWATTLELDMLGALYAGTQQFDECGYFEYCTEFTRSSVRLVLEPHWSGQAFRGQAFESDGAHEAVMDLFGLLEN